MRDFWHSPRSIRKYRWERGLLICHGWDTYTPSFRYNLITFCALEWEGQSWDIRIYEIKTKTQVESVILRSAALMQQSEAA